MKIAWLCKQKYMNHDVIRDQYGRLYHMPNELAQRHHEITGYCLDYSARAFHLLTPQKPENTSSHVTWSSSSIGPLGTNLPRYYASFVKRLLTNSPDILIGGSDCLHTILTFRLSKKTGIPFMLDLYDNFESFGLSRLPGMISGHRAAIKNALGITTVSDALRRHIQKLTPDSPVLTINSTIQEGEFATREKKISRKELGLDENAVLIGTAGSLSASRGTDMLYQVIDLVNQKIPNARLVLAGPTHGNPPPEKDDIIYLGELPHSLVPVFFSALDVAVICMKPDSFGEFAFPQKAYEILACKVPVVAAAVGPLQELFREYPDCLYSPSDIHDLSLKIANQLASTTPIQLPVPTWSDQAKKLDRFIRTLPLSPSR